MKPSKKYQRTRDAAFVRDLTRLCARLLRIAMNNLNGATNRAEREFALRSWSTAGIHLSLLCGGNSENLAGVLGKVALALEGKLRFHDDELLAEAFIIADREARKRTKGFDLSITPTPKAIYDAVKALRPEKEDEKPTKRGAVRRMKRLGWLDKIDFEPSKSRKRREERRRKRSTVRKRPRRERASSAR